jgi:hypothetical protein
MNKEIKLKRHKEEPTASGANIAWINIVQLFHLIVYSWRPQ